MGCDIHLHTEVKIGGTWHHYSERSVSRNYDLFALMAGVRNRTGITPISDPKGLPDDMSFMTRFAARWWQVDGHSHSWLGAEEIHKLYELIQDKVDLSRDFGYCFGGYWSGFHEYRNNLEEGCGIPNEVEDVRFVFWFDN
jgi:hypothetical protein